MGKSKILVVEDNAIVRKGLLAKLEANGYEVVGAATTSEAISATQLSSPDLMVLDVGLPDREMFNAIRDGFAVLGWLRRLLAEAASFPVVIYTVDDSPEILAAAQRLGVKAVLKKGGDSEELLRLVDDILGRSQAA